MSGATRKRGLLNILILENTYYLLTISIIVINIKSITNVHIKLTKAILSDPNLAILMTAI